MNSNPRSKQTVENLSMGVGAYELTERKTLIASNLNPRITCKKDRGFEFGYGKSPKFVDLSILDPHCGFAATRVNQIIGNI